MALNDENSGIPATMLVGPTGFGGYNNGSNGMGWGGDWAWIILLLLLAGNGGWGFGGGFGGFGGGLGYDFPWLLNGQQGINNNVSDGFRDAQLHDSVTSVRDGVSALATQLCNCCGDVQMSLANGFAGVQNGFAQAEIANNARQIADMQQMFSLQSALQNCCCENRAATADLKYTVATENCADRAALSDGIRDIIASNSANTQRILDKLCQDKIDAKNDEISQLRQELLYARGQASQDVQTAALRAGQATTANQLVAELRSCPIPAMPVYGMTPIFSCNSNNCGCNCGCGA